MGRNANDPDMSALARQLGELDLNTALDAMMRDRLEKDDSPKGVALFPDNKTYAVRLYLGGANRVIATTREPIHAAQCYDLAYGFFWRHRIRNPRPPTDSDLNTSSHWVECALQNETDALDILGLMEKHLMKQGALLTPEETEKRRKEDQERRKAARSNKGENRFLHLDTHVKLEELNEFLIETLKRHEALLRDASGERQALKAQLDSLIEIVKAKA